MFIAQAQNCRRSYSIRRCIMDILFDCDRPVTLEIKLGIADFGAFDYFESDHIIQHTSVIIDSATILRVQADITGSQQGGRRNLVAEEEYLSLYKATRGSLVFQGGHKPPLKAIAVLSNPLFASSVQLGIYQQLHSFLRWRKRSPF